MKAFAVITGTGKGYVEIDIIESTLERAKSHAAMLRRVFDSPDARVKVFEDDEAAYEWEEQYR